MAKATIYDFSCEVMRLIDDQPDSFIMAVSSNPKEPDQEIKRLRIRPVLIKGEMHFQLESFTKTQCFTLNLKPAELRSEFVKALSSFQQMVVRTSSQEVHASLVDDQVSYKIKELKTPHLPELSHNRSKRHVLQDGQPSELLQALGIMTREGSVLRDKYDKFKQINRFLELISDLLPEIAPVDGRELTVVDFGCGKAYLTFALYNMLKNATIIGLDARRDLIEKCTELAKALGYNKLSFKQSKIEDYQTKEPVDLVLALHACDTATDAALACAIQLEAQAILVAPCCQHEVASQIKKGELPLLLKHGLLKERFAASLTEALRAEILEQMGYSVDMCEFVDPEHTPKNLLIRAVRKKQPKKPDFSAYKEQSGRFGVSLTLAKLLKID